MFIGHLNKSLVNLSLFALALLSLSGCFVPHSTVKYDEKCDLLPKQYRLVLSSEGVSPILSSLSSVSCNDEECVLAQILAITAVPVGSFLVSGSVVVVGNTVNWIEQQGKCDESMTQKAFGALVKRTRSLGGKVIRSGAELMDWFRAKISTKGDI